MMRLFKKPSLNEFEQIRLIGTGNFCEVFHMVPKKMGKIPIADFAVKRINKKKVASLHKEAEVIMEKECLQKLNDPVFESQHPGWNNIVKLHFTQQDDLSLYLFLEYCRHGELWELTTGLGFIDIDLGLCFAAQLINGVEYMHSRNIVHRDLKAENLLLTGNGELRIIDFGTAMDLSRPELKIAGNRSGMARAGKTFEHYVGTAEFMPPEAVRNRSAGRSGDLWSLGCTLYQIFAGVAPFRAPSQFLSHLAAQNVLLQFPPHFPDSLKNLIERLLQVDPDNRLAAGMNDLTAIKSHDFFKGIDFNNPLSQYKTMYSPIVWPKLLHLCAMHLKKNFHRLIGAGPADPASPTDPANPATPTSPTNPATPASPTGEDKEDKKAPPGLDTLSTPSGRLSPPSQTSQPDPSLFLRRIDPKRVNLEVKTRELLKLQNKPNEWHCLLERINGLISLDEFSDNPDNFTDLTANFLK